MEEAPIRFWNLLHDPLMRSGPIKVLHISVEYTVELLVLRFTVVDNSDFSLNRLTVSIDSPSPSLERSYPFSPF